MNSVAIIGRLTKEPELRRTQNGTACCSFSLAVKRPRAKDTTDFLNFVVWQQGAEYLCQYGHKGDLVGAVGYLTARNWDDKDGNKRTAFEVTCEAIELVSSKKNSEGNTDASQVTNQVQSQPQHLQFVNQGGQYPPAYLQGNPNQYAQQGFQPVDLPDARLPF